MSIKGIYRYSMCFLRTFPTNSWRTRAEGPGLSSWCSSGALLFLDNGFCPRSCTVVVGFAGGKITGGTFEEDSIVSFNGAEGVPTFRGLGQEVNVAVFDSRSSPCIAAV